MVSPAAAAAPEEDALRQTGPYRGQLADICRPATEDFREERPGVEIIIVHGAPNVVRAVASETMPMGRINPDYVIGAIEKGARMRVVGGNMEKIPYDLMARAEIKGGADLKGKTIGVSTLTGGTTNMIEEVLEKVRFERRGLPISGRRHLAGALCRVESRFGAGNLHGAAIRFQRAKTASPNLSPSMRSSVQSSLPPISPT